MAPGSVGNRSHVASKVALGRGLGKAKNTIVAVTPLIIASIHSIVGFPLCRRGKKALSQVSLDRSVLVPSFTFKLLWSVFLRNARSYERELTFTDPTVGDIAYVRRSRSVITAVVYFLVLTSVVIHGKQPSKAHNAKAIFLVYRHHYSGREEFLGRSTPHYYSVSRCDIRQRSAFELCRDPSTSGPYHFAYRSGDVG